MVFYPGEMNPAFSSVWSVLMGEDISQPENTQESEFDAEAYLRKGERILSLEKEFQPRFKAKGLVSVMEAINCKTLAKKTNEYDKISYIDARIERFIRERGKEIAADAKNGGAIDFSVLESMFPEVMRPFIKLEEVTDGYGYSLVSSFFDTSRVLHISIGTICEGYAALTGVLSYKKHGRRYRWRRDRCTGEVIYDLGRILCTPVKYGILYEYLSTLSEKEKEEDSCCGVLRKTFQRFIEQSVDDAGVLHIAMEVRQHSKFMEYLAAENIPYIGVEAKDKKGLRGYMVQCWELLNGYALDPDDMFDGSIRFHHKMIDNALLPIMDVYEQDLVTKEYLQNISHSRAAVFQTKKNISKKTLEAMMQSEFNEYFGYVEFDDDVDISLVQEVEKEFRALNSILRLEKNEYASVRFRKLGNYKASGLYFPALKCLCVDIRTPASMAHEVFHMIDFENGELSRNASFDGVEALYSRLVSQGIEKLPAGDPLKEQWNGRSKYNATYYLTPTEIFARCGEIYLARICKVRNSLCVPDDELSVMYPDDETLNSRINEYFDSLLNAEASVESKTL